MALELKLGHRCHLPLSPYPYPTNTYAFQFSELINIQIKYMRVEYVNGFTFTSAKNSTSVCEFETVLIRKKARYSASLRSNQIRGFHLDT